jgi:predicted ABC-type sugar transport system permease subunit
MGDTSKEDAVAFTTVIRQDPLFELLMKAFYYGIIFLIVLVVVAVIVNVLRQHKNKPKYPGY